MPYCTQSDLTKKYGTDRITDLSRGTGTPDSDRVTSCISAADSEIDEHLRAIVDLPLSAVPAPVKDLSIQLSLHYLKESTEQGLSEQDLKVYDRLKARLEDIRDGKVTLEFGTTDEEASAKVTFVPTGNSLLFGRSNGNSY